MKEIWKDIDGYDGLYQVSNMGRIRMIKILNTYKSSIGYLHLGLSKDGISKHYLVHRLVAQAFLPNLYNLPEVNHIDEDKTNNCVNNLEWCTKEYNNNYGTRNERLRKRFGKPVRCKETGVIYPSTNEARKTIGCSYTALSNHLKGITDSCGGYHWEYIV